MPLTEDLLALKSINMLTIHRIWALIIRYYFIQVRNINRAFELSLWPILDIMMLGFITVWIQNSDSTLSTTAAIPLFGAFFWQIMIRTQSEFSVSLLEEQASKNLVNLFSTPLLFGEWICALVIFSILRLIVLFALGSTVIWLLYNLSIFNFGWWLLPIIILLVMSGWMIGCFTASLIMRYGQRMAAFTWASWIFTPFCGAFSPVTILPPWMYWIAKLLPMTYTFQAIQEHITTGTITPSLLITSYLINSLYLIGGMIFFNHMFIASKRSSLARLEVD